LQFISAVNLQSEEQTRLNSKNMKLKNSGSLLPTLKSRLLIMLW
jgi:hypothetical protein